MKGDSMTEKADKIFYNGQIYSMNRDGDICDAIAIRGDRIICVGSREDAMSCAGENTECIDLNGRTVLPAMGDAHLHAASTCELIFSFNMYDIGLVYGSDAETAMKAYQQNICENRLQMEAKGPLTVLRGTGWDPGYFMADTAYMPKASDIDAVCSDLPVILRSYDHHYVWVNSRVLEDSGITKDTPTPRNGVIYRDEEGNPTGLFQENSAIELVLGSVPYGDYSVEEYEQGILYYQSSFGNCYGTMLIFDALATENAITAYRNLAMSDKLTMRVTSVYATDPTKPMSQMDEIIARRGTEDIGDIFVRDTVKVFVDGTGLSIYMDEPYEEEYLRKIGCEPGFCGYPQWTLEELTEIFLKANGAGMPVHTHCMGDGAVRMTLDAIEAVERQGVNTRELRNTIAHFMAVRQEDIERMADLKVIACVQPIWGCYYSMTETIITEMIGDTRARAQYPMGSFKRAGVVMAAGTDFPVIIPPSPFLGFKVGVTRTIDRSHPEYERYKACPLGPLEAPMSEAVSLEDMIRMYSQGAAYQTFFEDVTGSLEVGKSADLVILNVRITDVDKEELDDVRAQQVIFKGKELPVVQEGIK